MTMESEMNDGEMSTGKNGSGGTGKLDEVSGVKRSTISQQNEAYGVHGGVKRATVTQQNEAYGMTKTATPMAEAFNIKQPDAGQENDEYAYVRFQT